ncbi:hypothetical protein Tco_1015409 [Tanacetum coccineum]|uniref:Uncharacterized protein n=1 Tax=Tanacetum coccineum TaxID=301880 RepID=A0ABQ5FL90_9ASTR
MSDGAILVYRCLCQLNHLILVIEELSKHWMAQFGIVFESVRESSSATKWTDFRKNLHKILKLATDRLFRGTSSFVGLAMVKARLPLVVACGKERRTRARSRSGITIHEFGDQTHLVLDELERELGMVELEKSGVDYLRWRKTGRSNLVSNHLSHWWLDNFGKNDHPRKLHNFARSPLRVRRRAGVLFSYRESYAQTISFKLRQHRMKLRGSKSSVSLWKTMALLFDD